MQKRLGTRTEPPFPPRPFALFISRFSLCQAPTCSPGTSLRMQGQGQGTGLDGQAAPQVAQPRLPRVSWGSQQPQSPCTPQASELRGTMWGEEPLPSCTVGFLLVCSCQGQPLLGCEPLTLGRAASSAQAGTDPECPAQRRSTGKVSGISGQSGQVLRHFILFSPSSLHAW